MSKIKPIKCVVAGDGAVGKTCMLETYSEGRFPKAYIPTVFDNFNSIRIIDGNNVNLSLWDTAGQEGYDRLRLLSYPQTDVVILCFSICSKDSLANIATKWLPEVKEHCPNKAIFLVGTKKDKRYDNPGAESVSEAEGQKQADTLGITKYLECSALTQEGLNEVFEEACRIVLKPTHEAKKKQCCNICRVF